MIKVWTDGSCMPNPGVGAWAYATIDEYGTGGELNTTNNRMELSAVLMAVTDLSKMHPVIVVVTDSKYVKDGIEKWIHGWKRNSWKTAAGKPVKNEDLWKQLDQAVSKAHVTFEWTKGHADDQMNNYVDSLCNETATALKRSHILKVGH